MFNFPSRGKIQWCVRVIIISFLGLCSLSAAADMPASSTNDKSENQQSPAINQQPQENAPTKSNKDISPASLNAYRNLPVPAVIVPVIPYCTPTTVTLCNTSVAVPFTGAPGASYTLTLPLPNQSKNFTVQCVNVGTLSVYQVINPETISCAPPVCSASAIQVCGVSIPIEGGTSIGNEINVPIPASIIGTNATYNHPSFKAVCVATADGTGQYQLADNSEISCNLFPCAGTSVRLCETDIPVKGGAGLGEVLHMTMPPPFVNDPFDVSCVGTLGQQPIYQITDSGAVTCQKAPVSP